LTEKEK